MRLLSRAQIERTIAGAKTYWKYRDASEEERLLIIADAIEETIMYTLHCLSAQPEEEGLDSKMVTVIKRKGQTVNSDSIPKEESEHWGF